MACTSLNSFSRWLLIGACISGYSFGPVLAQEVHTVSFTNNCGMGTPILGGVNGEFYPIENPVPFQGPAWGLISYLQYTDEEGNEVCGKNGEGCTMIEATLSNTGSSADITLIPPHVFTVESGFEYYGGCDGSANCASQDCTTAKHNSSQGWLQVPCTAANVNLNITFCA